MTNLQRHWLSMAKKHSLTVDIPFTLALVDGTAITVEVRLQGYGADNGMLLDSDYSILKGRTEIIEEMGYGFSCLSQPAEERIDSDECLRDLLDDWGENVKEKCRTSKCNRRRGQRG